MLPRQLSQITQPQEASLIEQFQIQSTNKLISFTILKKIFLSVVPNRGTTQEVLDIICNSERFKIEGITLEQFLSYIKLITRQLSHSQGSHSYGIFLGTQLLKLVDKKLIIEKQSQQLPVYKVPKDLQQFLHQSDLDKRYLNDLLTDYQKKKLSYKKKAQTYRLWNYQAQTKQKDSNPFKEKLNNKYSQIFRAALGLEFKYILQTLRQMDQNDKELKVLRMITKQFSQLQDLAASDRELNKFFKSRESYNCEAFKIYKKKLFIEVSRNKAIFLIKWSASLSNTFKHPYLKAITLYWGNERDWTGQMFQEISFNENLSLVDKFFFAKWNLNQAMYDKFMEKVIDMGQKSDKLEYILLFGKRVESAKVIQNYYDSTLDIQTVALLCIYFIIGGFDGKTEKYDNIYQYLLNTYKNSLRNSHKNIILEVFEKKERQIQAQQNIIDDKMVSMRCNNCGTNLSLCASVTKDSEKKGLNTFPVVQQCPFCADYAHRCSTCLIPIEMRNPGFMVYSPKVEENYRKQSVPIDMGVLFCLKCKHGGHFFHTYEWFMHQTICPIPDCGCQCYL